MRVGTAGVIPDDNVAWVTVDAGEQVEGDDAVWEAKDEGKAGRSDSERGTLVAGVGG